VFFRPDGFPGFVVVCQYQCCSAEFVLKSTVNRRSSRRHTVKAVSPSVVFWCSFDFAGRAHLGSNLMESKEQLSVGSLDGKSATNAQLKQGDGGSTDAACSCIDPKNVGCVDLFPYLLWKRLGGPADFNSADSASFVRLPDTVVFSRYRPTEWLFTSKKDGLLKRKHGRNVTVSNIVKAFSPPQSQAAAERCAIVATFVYCSDYVLDRDQPYVRLAFVFACLASHVLDSPCNFCRAGGLPHGGAVARFPVQDQQRPQSTASLWCVCRGLSSRCG
jgi:hypothetical protein